LFRWIRSGVPVVFLLRRYPEATWSIGMNNKLLNCLIAGAVSTTLAIASPAFAAHGGMGGGGTGGGGGMGGGSIGGGGMASGPAVSGGAQVSAGPNAGGARFGGTPQFNGNRFDGARAGFSPRTSSFERDRFAFRDRNRFDRNRFAFQDRDRRFFHNRFDRFAFADGAAFASYDSCLRREWTPYGPRWVDVCGY
jgi:hypothetical protein